MGWNVIKRVNAVDQGHILELYWNDSTTYFLNLEKTLILDRGGRFH